MTETQVILVLTVFLLGGLWAFYDDHQERKKANVQRKRRIAEAKLQEANGWINWNLPRDIRFYYRPEPKIEDYE